jgi:hypothetical protein
LANVHREPGSQGWPQWARPKGERQGDGPPNKKKGVHTTIEKLLLNTNLPFTNRVMNFPLLDNFKVPPISSYDGRGDPITHIEGFQVHPFFHSIPNETACRVFPLTLKGEVREWFSSLGLESIDNFSTLERQFLNQFSAIQRRKQHHASLFSLVQRETEYLEDFVKRFGQEMRTVKDPSEQCTKFSTRNSMNRCSYSVCASTVCV